jgi:hypothetical protein
MRPLAQTEKSPMKYSHLTRNASATVAANGYALCIASDHLTNSLQTTHFRVWGVADEGHRIAAGIPSFEKRRDGRKRANQSRVQQLSAGQAACRRRKN